MRRVATIWDHPRFIAVLSTLYVLTLALAAFAAFNVLPLDEQREKDRIDSDLAACSRVNLLRDQVVDGFVATELAFEQILAIFFPDGETSDPRVVEVRAQIDPILAELHTTFDGVEATNCEAVTPGGNP